VAAPIGPKAVYPDSPAQTVKKCYQKQNIPCQEATESTAAQFSDSTAIYPVVGKQPSPHQISPAPSGPAKYADKGANRVSLFASSVATV